MKKIENGTCCRALEADGKKVAAFLLKMLWPPWPPLSDVTRPGRYAARWLPRAKSRRPPGVTSCSLRNVPNPPVLGGEKLFIQGINVDESMFFSNF